MKFKRPSYPEKVKALGEIDSHSSKLYDLKSPLFEAVRKPKAGDWLREHEERGQSLKQYGRMILCAKPHATFRTIYIQPIGYDESAPEAPPLGLIKLYCEAFFDTCFVEILPHRTFAQASKIHPIHSRHSMDTNCIQYLAPDILDYLMKSKKAYRHLKNPIHKKRFRTEICSIALTMADIYPREEWNYVFGLANICDSVGIWSLARMNPHFPASSPKRMLIEENQLILWRSLQVITHELGHLFGLKHCIYFTCLMNGSNHQGEADASPLHLCPICLRKLQSNLKFNEASRYSKIKEVLQNINLMKDANWFQCRLESI
mmetsp:Transcript_187/g.322  ORF Transcript_187/g.322 Transcript_187/m.322 type:complete len:317 (+) Transcript_187:1372-2322(+)